MCPTLLRGLPYGVVSDVAPDVDEDELPPLPAELSARVTAFLEELADLHALEHAAVRELLWRVLERIGRLEAFSLEQAGLLARGPEDARDDQEREELLEQERAFVAACPRKLETIAQAALAFTLALWLQCRPDWEDPAQTVTEVRTELDAELATEVAPPRRRHRLEPTKPAVTDSMKATLWRAASEVACAAHELADARFPGTAGTTMLTAAASLTVEAFDIRQAIAR